MHRFLLLSTVLYLLISASNSHANLFINSQQCGQCHSEQLKAWQQSHHFSAMAAASPETVLGDFDNREFQYNGITSLFYTKDNRYFVRTDNASGELEDFEIKYTFGISPLQQYLIDLPDGRKQVLNIMWDSRSAFEGGQRWYHLYPEHPIVNHGNNNQPIDSTSPFHWTKSYFNWNSRCAACHSTQLKKNYSPADNQYQTSWSEMNVGCESCHGNGQKHVAWTKKNKSRQERDDNKGLAFSIADLGRWQAKTDESISGNLNTLTRSGPTADKQKKVCAGCHSRRSELTTPDPQLAFDDNYLLSLIEPPLYYADGQIRDEVYVWGSFLQSKMHHEGVTCSNCHQPHSQKLKAEGNTLCSQCHNPTFFDTSQHHRHSENSEGSQCVSCHMPTTTYMGVDDRRDHSFRIPRPALSASVGAPNACNQCHNGWSADKSQQIIDQWLTNSGKTQSVHPFASAFFSAEQFSQSDSKALADIASNRELPDIVRASALQRLTDMPSQLSITTIMQQLQADSALIRLGAVNATAGLPLQLRYQLLSGQLDEKALSVRVEMARQLTGVTLTAVNILETEKVKLLFTDYLKMNYFNADIPERQVMLGQFYLGNLQLKAAEKAYQHALTLAPDFTGALVNLADLYRQTNRDVLAEPLLIKATLADPTSAVTYYALGLLYIRQQKLEQAIVALSQASKHEYSNPIFAYTYALALKEHNTPKRAIAYLAKWIEINGEEPQVVQVLRSLNDIE